MSAPVDIRGQVFGELTAIEPTGRRQGGRIVWRCRCSCGAEVFAPAKELRSGNTKSCGHLKKQINDLTGQRFGKLVAEYDTGKRYQHNVVWHCRCDCGNEVDVMGRSLTSGNTRSCGCLNRDARPAPYDALGGTRAAALTSKPPSSNTSGVRGVSWHKQKQDWEAYIKFKGQHFHLGHYDTLEEARGVREKAQSMIYGDFLRYYTELTLSPPGKKKAGRPPVNIQGKRYGSLVALYPTNRRENTSLVWRCQCDCGNLVDVRQNHLQTGQITCCPKCKKKKLKTRRASSGSPCKKDAHL